MRNTINNPIIQTQIYDTLHFSVGCLEYLIESLHHFSFEESSENARRGITLLLTCINSALKFEANINKSDHSLANPLICPSSNNTLQNCAESLAYIKEVSDHKFGLNGFSQLVQLGLYSCIECVQEALAFEYDRAQAEEDIVVKKKLEILERALKDSAKENQYIRSKRSDLSTSKQH